MVEQIQNLPLEDVIEIDLVDIVNISFKTVRFLMYEMD